MSDNPYYGFEKESTQGTALPISEYTGLPYDPEWFSESKAQRKSDSDLDVTIYKGKPSLWPMITKLFHCKPKPPVQFKETIGPYISMETEYEGKRYRGILYPVEEEDNA